MTRRLLPFLLALTIPAISNVASAAQRLLITDQAAGAVVEFTDGGDVSGNVFAHGLSEPGGICVGPGNDVYVAEFGTGELTIVSAGGDMTNQPAFADSAENELVTLQPVGLWCNDSVVLVVDLQGAVVNAVIGGSEPLAWPIFTYWPPAENPFPLDVAQTPAGNVFVSTGEGIFRADLGVTAGTPPIATGQPFLSLEAFGDVLMVGVGDGPRIFDATLGPDLSGVDPWATLPGEGSVIALLDAGERQYAASGSAIYDVTGGGDLTQDDPFATGLSEGLLYQGMARWVCGSDADCDDGDACNGAESCTDNACVDAEAPLACDDDNVCTADACDVASGCVHTPIENCCVADLDCALDEVCDTASNVCEPVIVPTTGDGEGSSSAGDDDGSEGGELPEGTTGEEPTTGPGESGGDTDDGAAEGEASGCAVGGRTAPMWLLMLGLWGLHRRRD